MGFSELHVRTFNCGCVCNTHTRSLDLFHDLVVSEEVPAASEIRGGSGTREPIPKAALSSPV